MNGKRGMYRGMSIRRQRGEGVIGEVSTDSPVGLHEIRLVNLRQYYSGTCHYNILRLNTNSFDSSFYLFLTIVFIHRLCVLKFFFHTPFL